MRVQVVTSLLLVAASACQAFHTTAAYPLGLRSTKALQTSSPAVGPALRQRGAGGAVGPRMVFGMETAEDVGEVWSPAGMDVKTFFDMSIGEWKSLRSSHNIAFSMLEEVTTDMVIEDVAIDSDEIKMLCKNQKVDIDKVILASKVSWDGYSDWDDKEINGTSTFALLQETPTTGKLLRSVGYAEEIPAASDWEMTERGEFLLKTNYDMVAAEESFTFKTPNFRLRVSSIKTQGGRGITTCSLSTEVRQTSKEDKKEDKKDD
eukprot:CAMPEP_0173391712 /NCGR_PEP_ID=MMETSP1356-20130122/18541_1 /TAXON_ID=77927 ORGANISM="Hemiselmis virescens, Strain PCC157" /NCGR_SAMPLE_ID=MMETSP1356 /ASSEMBLY_ACC=CAM_ASM_000847 /LENGTH=261 /DNA_ID=CAMNT_0014349389 /DNA_START=87 /DNA_END=872 /DNA_ORIENTATION=-